MGKMNEYEENLYWYWLYNIEGIGLKSIQKLMNYFESPKEIYFKCKVENLQELKIQSKGIQNFFESKNMENVKGQYNHLMKKNIKVITYADEMYPKKLKNIYQPPGVLYVRGQLPKEDKITIAIVGARNCSNYGKEIAMYFAKELSKAGVQIVSGLARGIDSFAHRGSLNEVGKTFGILGCGIDVCYPKENLDLYMNMIEQGGIISEYNMGYRPLKGNFPMRNRIISGFSDGILLVEAKEKSGSLITMDMGLEQGKNIYACPGRISDELSNGTNHMIQQGGKLVLSAHDILEDYGIMTKMEVRELKTRNFILEQDEKIVYEKLSLMPKHMEELLQETGFAVTKLSEILMKLQLLGAVKQAVGNTYCHNIQNDEKN